LSATPAGLFERVLTFCELHAGQAATHRNDAITIDASSTCDVLEEMAGAGHSRFPVTSDGDVVGVVHVGALLQLERVDWSGTEVRVLMTEPVVIPEAASLTSALHTLRSAGAEMAVVIDEYGDLAGLITIEDLAEELIGEIQDETDPDPARARHPNHDVWSSSDCGDWTRSSTPPAWSCPKAQVTVRQQPDQWVLRLGRHRHRRRQATPPPARHLQSPGAARSRRCR
jgi:CBS domain containing-hemolysin-like protein